MTSHGVTVPKEVLDKAIQELDVLNHSMGYDPVEIYQGLQRSIEDSISDYLYKNRKRLEHLRASCQEEFSKIEIMRSVLSDVPIEAPVMDMTPPFRQLLNKLKDLRSEFASTWDKRLARRHASVTAARILSKQLGTCPEPMMAEISRDPQQEETRADSLSLVVICDLEACVDDMKRLKSDRMSVVTDIQTEIHRLWALLGTPESYRNQQISNPDEWLTLSAMANLDNIRNELQEQTRIRQIEINDLWNKAHRLWRMLDLPENERMKEESRQDLSTGMLNKLKFELSRLEEQKQQHMEKVVTNTRIRLNELWDALMFSDDERRQFSAAFTTITEYTDEVFSQHENECDRLEKMLQDPSRRQILAHVRAYQELRKLEEELLEASKDPERLKRRGTRLLEEGRKRVRVEKRKPIIVPDLLKLLDEWKNSHDGTAFTVYGADFAAVLRDQEKKLLSNRRSSLSSRDLNAPAKSKVTPDNSKVQPSATNNMASNTASNTEPRLRSSSNTSAPKRVPSNPRGIVKASGPRATASTRAITRTLREVRVKGKHALTSSLERLRGLRDHNRGNTVGLRKTRIPAQKLRLRQIGNNNRKENEPSASLYSLSSDAVPGSEGQGVQSIRPQDNSTMSPQTMYESWKSQEIQRLRDLNVHYGGNDTTLDISDEIPKDS